MRMRTTGRWLGALTVVLAAAGCGGGDAEFCTGYASGAMAVCSPVCTHMGMGAAAADPAAAAAIPAGCAMQCQQVLAADAAYASRCTPQGGSVMPAAMPLTAMPVTGVPGQPMTGWPMTGMPGMTGFPGMTAAPGAATAAPTQ